VTQVAVPHRDRRRRQIGECLMRAEPGPDTEPAGGYRTAGRRVSLAVRPTGDGAQYCECDEADAHRDLPGVVVVLMAEPRAGPDRLDDRDGHGGGAEPGDDRLAEPPPRQAVRAGGRRSP